MNQLPERDVVVGTTETELCPYEQSRSKLVITNTHSSAIIKVTSHQNESATGIRLYPQTMMILQRIEGDECEKQHFAVSDTASTTVNVHEEYEV